MGAGQTVLLIIVFLIIPTAAHAHGGGLDGLGCHHNRKQGGYHCHQGPLAGQSFSSKAEVQGTSQRRPETLQGVTRVIDGDTIQVAASRVRLHGIDAPESDQTCIRNGQKYSCGKSATKALAAMVTDRQVTCQPRNTDRYGRVIAVCLVGATDIGARMVAQGWALAYRRYSMDYVDQESTAELSRMGMWAGKFVEPWKWRQGAR